MLHNNASTVYITNNLTECCKRSELTFENFLYYNHSKNSTEKISSILGQRPSEPQQTNTPPTPTIGLPQPAPSLPLTMPSWWRLLCWRPMLTTHAKCWHWNASIGRLLATEDRNGVGQALWSWSRTFSSRGQSWSICGSRSFGCRGFGWRWTIRIDGSIEWFWGSLVLWVFFIECLIEFVEVWSKILLLIVVICSWKLNNFNYFIDPDRLTLGGV